MERNRLIFRWIGIASTAIVILVINPARSSAGIVIASDSYTIGTDPTAGQYVAGSSLNAELLNQTNTGFVNGPYNHGFGTANFQVSATGLASVADGATSTDSGSVYWQGVSGTAIKSVARNLSNFNEGTSGTYWMSMLVKSDGTNTTTDGFVLSGFGNSVAPTLGTTAGNLAGIYFGFSDNSRTANEADLVLRYRDSTGMTTKDQLLVNGANNATANQTYLVVAQVNINYKGSLDQVNYWVNPADLNSVNDLNSTSISKGSLDTYAYQGAPSGTGDFTRLNYAASDWNAATTFFDEQRLGTTLDSIAPQAAPVPEPASLVLTVLGGGLMIVVNSLRRGRKAG